MTLDLAGVGIGPFNLSLAALAEPLDGFEAAFFERGPEFRWHPGLMIEGAALQVPFLADLVSLVDPTSQLSFLAYLRARERLYPFYFAEKFHIPRAEYADYCAWVSRRLLEDGTAVLGRATIDGQVWLKVTLLRPGATAAEYAGLLDLVAQ